MYRNLNSAALGITGRQSELIELALTYGFDGLDLDMEAIVRRARASGIDKACRFVSSAGIRIGEFTVPIELTASEATFRSSLVELGEVAEIAASLKATSSRITVTPVSDGVPYQENFELHRARLADVAGALAPHGIRLGLALAAASSHWKDADVPFIHTTEALMTLIRTVGNPQIGLALDTWNWFVGGGSLDDLLAVSASDVVAFLD